MTTYPKIKTPSSGLSFSRGVWSASYRVDGRRRTRSLGTIHRDEAATRRGEFYDELRRAGATENTPAATGPKNPTYISKRPAYRVKVGKVWVGDYETEGEAQVALREWQSRGANL